jgi:pyruvate carboxylase
MEGTSEILADAFSFEMWGGATFDWAYRFLHESPWERLDMVRARVPNVLLQMLLRGANAVGYTNYPDNLIRAFIREAAQSGIDVFRIFDSLNWIPGMEIAMDEVLKCGKLCEASICYTGDILDPKRDKYTLQYYVNMARELEKRGSHILCIKDMSGLLKPYAAKKLVSTLKQEIGIPVQLHTHDTSGNQVAALLLAAEAGVDVVDCAISSMSSLTTQPSLNPVVPALQGQERDTGLDPDELQHLTDYWEDVRHRYNSFEAGTKSPATDIYRYEIPGGQYTNLKPQVGEPRPRSPFPRGQGKLPDRQPDSWRHREGYALLQDGGRPRHLHDAERPDAGNIVEKGENLAFPDSVVSNFEGMMGQPAWGFRRTSRRPSSRGKSPSPAGPASSSSPSTSIRCARK